MAIGKEPFQEVEHNRGWFPGHLAESGRVG